MLSNNELATFCDQMAMILRSGISSIEGIAIMRDDAATEQGRQLLDKIYAHIEETGSLADSLINSGEFPPYLSDMTRIGEQSGRLDDVMSSLSGYYEREEGISKGIKSAITYPLIMILMMFVVIGVLIAKVLPVFNNVFRQLGTETTGISHTLMNLGSSSGVYLIVILVILLILAGIIFYLLKNNTAFRTRFFASRKLYEEIAAGRFASGMALTLSSGLDTDDSLEMVGKLTDHPEIQKKIQQCKAHIQEGDGFAEALTKSNIFTGMYSRMVSIGMKTGSLDEVMAKIAGQYEESVDNRIAHILSILEPSLVAVLAVIVGIILLSVMLPLMGIMSSLG